MPRRSLEQQARLAACKVKKKGIESKRANMEKVRDLVDRFQYCFVFDIRNFRNKLMKDVKEAWPTSRFFQGKVKPTSVALGKHLDDEYRNNLHLVSQSLQIDATGAHRGLFFTNNSPKDVIKWFNNYKVTTFAKTGFVATEDFVVKKGALKNFVFSQEYTLRRLGLAVILRNGRLMLDADYTICKRGQPLKPEQCKLLELFNQPQAKFEFQLYSFWSNEHFYKIDTKTLNIEQITGKIHQNSGNNNNGNVNFAMLGQEDVKIDDTNESKDDNTNFKNNSNLNNNNNNNKNLNGNFGAKNSINNDQDDVKSKDVNQQKRDLFGVDAAAAAFIDDDDDEEEEDDDVLQH